MFPDILGLFMVLFSLIEFLCTCPHTFSLKTNSYKRNKTNYISKEYFQTKIFPIEKMFYSKVINNR